jgi:hypothetical protein
METTFAYIQSGVVINTVIADNNFAQSQVEAGVCDTAVNITGTKVGIGWTYDGTNFTAPPPPPQDS